MARALVLFVFLGVLSFVVSQSVTPPYPLDPDNSGRPYNIRFDGAFSLINITSPCPSGTGFCAGDWANNGRGVIGYWAFPGHPGYGNMSASLNHDVDNSTGNATAATVLGAGGFYAGAFLINVTGGYVGHYPITSSNPAGIKTGGKEVRCFQWFEDDNVLRLFITSAFTDCTGNVVAQLYWRRIVPISMKNTSGASALAYPIAFILAAAVLLLI